MVDGIIGPSGLRALPVGVAEKRSVHYFCDYCQAQPSFSLARLSLALFLQSVHKLLLLVHKLLLLGHKLLVLVHKLLLLLTEKVEK